MKDRYGRTIKYLRLSVTDLCNCRCVYCIGENGVPRRRRTSSSMPRRTSGSPPVRRTLVTPSDTAARTISLSYSSPPQLVKLGV